VFVAVPFAVVVAVLATLVWASTYDPICHQACGGLAAIRGKGVTELGSFTSPEGEHFIAVQVTFRPGGEFGYWFSLFNEGSFGVTITNVGGPPNRFDPIPVTRVAIQTAPGGGSGSATAPFHPFSLAPHSSQEADVFVTHQMRGCIEEGGALEFGSIPITYRFLGITQHTTVSLPESFSVVGETGSTCPNGSGFTPPRRTRS
jgi:hypothetical protein